MYRCPKSQRSSEADGPACRKPEASIVGGAVSRDPASYVAFPGAGRLQDDRYGYGFWPYILPYTSFVLLAQFSGRFPEDWWLALLFVKPLVPLGMIAFFYSRGMYPELRGFAAFAKGAPLDIALGVISGLLWMVPYLVAPDGLGESLRSIEIPLVGIPWPDTADGFDATHAGAEFAALAIAFRGFGYVIVTPQFEELFIRSFVMRFAIVYDVRKDFRDVPIATYTARSFWLTTLFFTIGHVGWEYWVAVPWVMATSWWFYRRRHIGALILLHGAANATILIAAVIADGPLWYFV